ncbi:MAG: hypothetical protein SGI74_10320 [Oligoflexia bacterium]|nr:hypothetical protein [Oligoflexia bacterium]
MLITDQVNRREGKISLLFFSQCLLVAIAIFTILFLPSDFKKKNRDTRITLKGELLSHLSLGFKLIVSDFIWIRLVQEIDYRELKSVSKGWAFQMLDSVTTLDPRYHTAYTTGVTVLSILVQDVEGASILYDRAVQNYPTHWPLLYRAAYHNLYEVGDCPKAAGLLYKAGLHGAPNWVNSLASRLYVRSGQFELARGVLIDALKRFEGTELEPRLKDRLKELEEAEKQPVTLKNQTKQCKPPTN